MYKEGDFIFDTKFNEVFEYEAKVDEFAIKNEPDRFRLATEEEIKSYKD